VTALDALRARVRPGLEAGPLCDEQGFVRGFEATLRGLFDRHRGEEAVRGVA